MRHVVKSSEVFHMWANQTQSYARSGNISFDHRLAYSYGQCIGEYVVNSRDERGYIINADAWRSNATQSHLSELRRAIPSHKTDQTWTVPIGNAYTSESLCYLLNEITEIADKAKRARSNKPYLLARIPCMIESAQRFAAFFDITDIIIPDTAEEITGLTAAMLQAERDKAEEREAQLQAKYAADHAAGKLEWENDVLPAWIDGAAIQAYYGCKRYRDQYAYMRVVGANDTAYVETTFGARVPLAEVKALAPRILSIFDSGKEWTNAHNLTLGGYHVHSIKDGILTVGCHQFTEAEIRRFAAVIAEYTRMEYRT